MNNHPLLLVYCCNRGVRFTNNSKETRTHNTGERAMERFRFATTTKQLLLRAMCFGAAACGQSAALASEHPANDVANAAMVLGLDASSLAVVGVTNSEISTVLDALDEEYSLFQSMMTQHTNEANASKAIADANARLRIDAADTQAQQDLADAQTDAVLASNAIVSLKTQLLTKILDGIAESQLISPILLDESVISRLPAAYRLAVDTNDEAKTLQWALRLETRVDANGGTLPSEATAALNDARAEYEYQAAKIRVETYSAANQAAFDRWITDI